MSFSLNSYCVDHCKRESKVTVDVSPLLPTSREGDAFRSISLFTVGQRRPSGDRPSPSGAKPPGADI